MTVPPSFDLVSEKWVPCVRLDGSTDELGLLDTLVHAHELREVVDASPLVTASLHRLLLAILHRNFGPRNYDAWRKLWEAGEFDAEIVGAYFDKWRHRFDLFDEERPFYQTPGMDEKMLKPVACLAHEIAQGNNPTLFDHSCEDQAVALRPSESARLLVTHQATALHGLVSRERPEWRSAKAGTIARGFLVMPAGASLFASLMLNALPVSTRRFDEYQDDAPAWECADACCVEERSLRGYLDLLTWQSRRVWLEPDPSEGDLHVRRAISAKGCEFLDGMQPDDPMMAYIAPRDRSKEPHALEFDERRVLWRDSMVLLTSERDLWRQPQTIEHLAELVITGDLPGGAVLDLSVFGMALQGSQRRNIGFWRHERLPLPLRYLADDELVDYLHECVQLTERVHGSLYGAACELAEEALTAGGRSADTHARDQFIASLGVSSAYWAALELPFRELVVALAEEDGDRYALEASWAELLRSTAWEVFERAQRSLAPNARNLRASSHARRVLGGSLRKHLA